MIFQILLLRFTVFRLSGRFAVFRVYLKLICFMISKIFVTTIEQVTGVMILIVNFFFCFSLEKREGAKKERGDGDCLAVNYDGCVARFCNQSDNNEE